MNSCREGKSHDYTVQIAVAIIGFLGAIVAAWVESRPEPLRAQRWQAMGLASTGEMLAVDSESVSLKNEIAAFKYKIGDETILAEADCDNNEWHTEQYGSYAPESEATQGMMNYVCQN